MKQDYDIFMNEVAKEIRTIAAPKQVDVTDAVMDALRNKAVMAPQREGFTWKKAMVGVAACLLIALAVNISRFISNGYDDAAIDNMFAELYDYGDQYGGGDYGYEDFSSMSYFE